VATRPAGSPSDLADLFWPADGALYAAKTACHLDGGDRFPARATVAPTERSCPVSSKWCLVWSGGRAPRRSPSGRGGAMLGSLSVSKELGW